MMGVFGNRRSWYFANASLSRPIARQATPSSLIRGRPPRLWRRESLEGPSHGFLDARSPSQGFAGSRELGLGRAPPNDRVRAGIHDVEDARPFPVLAGHHHRHARTPSPRHRPDISKGRSVHGRRLRPAPDAHVPLDDEVRAARLLPIALAPKRLV